MKKKEEFLTIPKKHNFWKLSFFIILTMFLAYFLYENYIVERFLNKINNYSDNNNYLTSDINMENYVKIKEQTKKYLLKQDSKLRMTNNFTNKSRLEKFLKQNQNNVSKKEWSNAFLLYGLIKSYQFDKDKKTLDLIESYTDHIIFDNGGFKEKLSSVDDCMIGYTFLDLYEITKKTKYKAACDNIAYFLIKKHIKTKTGTIPYVSRNPNLLLVDTIGMISPFLIRYGESYNNQVSVQLGTRQIKEFFENGFDEKTGLPYHAYDLNNNRKYGLIGWTRGIGWLSLGLADGLNYLSEKNPDYLYLNEKFKILNKNITAYLNKDNVLFWYISYPYGGYDTSGTEMIAYSFEKDVSKRQISEFLLGKTLKLTLNKGEVQNALAECQNIGNYPAVFGPSNFAQGMLLAHYSDVIKRKSPLK